MWSKKPLVCDTTLPPDERSLYYQLLKTKYDELVARTKGGWYKRHTEPWDEDIFHDTIINCVNACCKMNDKEEIFRYFYHSYEMNMLREKNYSCSKNHIYKPVHTPVHDTQYELFMNEFRERITKDWNERIANIVIDYYNGYKYDELVKKYKIKNIHIKAGPLRKYVRELLESYKST